MSVQQPYQWIPSASRRTARSACVLAGGVTRPAPRGPLGRL